MPASAKTANFDLPQYRNLDTVSMLVTFNGAMQKIDTALQNIKTTADVGSADIDDLQQSVDRLTTEVAALNQGFAAIIPRSDYPVNLTQPGVQYGNASIGTIGSTLVLGRFNALTVTKANMQETPSSTNTYYTLFTMPDDIFGFTKTGADNALSIGHCSFLSTSNTTSAVVWAWRDNNLTYIGFSAGKDEVIQPQRFNAIIMRYNNK